MSTIYYTAKDTNGKFLGRFKTKAQALKCSQDYTNKYGFATMVVDFRSEVKWIYRGPWYYKRED